MFIIDVSGPRGELGTPCSSKLPGVNQLLQFIDIRDLNR